MAQNEIINVNIIISTDLLMAAYPNPSKDQNKPTGIAHTYEYMVVSGSAFQITGSGSGNLSFSAVQGDVVRFTASSEYDNFANPVILYGLFRYGGDMVFSGPFQLEIFPNTTTAVPTSFNPLVVNTAAKATFWAAQNTVNQTGSENYGLQFAVYTTPRGSSGPQLFGYFQWDPTITATNA